MPSLPFGLTTYKAKLGIINSQTPIVGEAAIMNYSQPYGHIGKVIGVSGNKIMIQEANYQKCAIGTRTGTREQLHIVGYFRPAGVNPPAPAQPQTSGYPKNVTVRVPAVMVRVSPNTGAALGGSKRLTKGTTIQVVGQVAGQSVSGNNIWFRSIKGNYCWSGGF
jgi:hypothetical protein